MPKKITESPNETLRELTIRKADSFGNWEIAYQGGGVIPAKLRGVYTTPTAAQFALDNYLLFQGIENEAKKLKEEIKSIEKLDYSDEV